LVPYRRIPEHGSVRLITIGFTGKMNCFSLDSGKLIWSHDLVKEYGGKIQEYGYSSSPTVRLRLDRSSIQHVVPVRMKKGDTCEDA